MAGEPVCMGDPSALLHQALASVAAWRGAGASQGVQMATLAVVTERLRPKSAAILVPCRR